MSERSQQLRRDTAGKELEEIRKDYKPMSTVKLVPYYMLPAEVIAEKQDARAAGKLSCCVGCVYRNEGRDAQGVDCGDAPDCDGGVFREVP